MTFIEKHIKIFQQIAIRFIADFTAGISGMSLLEMERFITTLNILEELNAQGFSTEYETFRNKYDDELFSFIQQAKDRGIGFSIVNLALIEQIKELDTGRILRRAADFGDELKSLLLKQMADPNITSKQISQTLLPKIQEQVPFMPNWFESALNTTYFQYNEAAKVELFSDQPDLRWKLDHVFDERTRPVCRHAIEEMKKYPEGLTVKEINKGKLGEGYTFVNRGGVNCRGDFILAEGQ